jgi:hypothetical protein
MNKFPYQYTSSIIHERERERERGHIKKACFSGNEIDLG